MRDPIISVVPSVDSRSRSRRAPSAPPVHVGILLREWRAARRLSQMELALEAHVSPRHLSYVETGKAQPSRDMIMRLADTLEMPLRERNALLVAAGYAPTYPESALANPELARIRHAIELTLEHHEPFPALVVDRYWDLVMTNRAGPRLFSYLRGGSSAHANILRQVFDPRDMRALIANWEEVAGDLIGHLHDRIAAVPSDARARSLLDEILGYPGVPQRWRLRGLDLAPPPLLTVVFRKGNEELSFFSTIATFGTPRDVTLDELHIECMFPADEATAERCKSLARDEAG